jgi:hypothetical protein
MMSRSMGVEGVRRVGSTVVRCAVAHVGADCSAIAFASADIIIVKIPARDNGPFNWLAVSV